MMIRHGMALFGLVILVTLGVTRAHADDAYLSPTDDRVRVSLGVMRVSNATTLRVDSSTGVSGTVLEGEDQFALDRSDWEPKFQVMLRAGTRNRLWLDYFTLDRDGSTVVQQPLVFRDVALQPGDPLQSELDFRMLSLTYGYSFWHSETLELAATLGVSSIQLDAQAKVTTDAVHINQMEDIAGPFPLPGLAATWVLSRHFYIDGRVQYLSLHVQDLDGSLGTAELNVLYRLRPNVSFALGYTEIKAHLDSVKPSSSGLFDLTSRGPQLFVRVSF